MKLERAAFKRPLRTTRLRLFFAGGPGAPDETGWSSWGGRNESCGWTESKEEGFGGEGELIMIIKWRRWMVYLHREGLLYSAKPSGCKHIFASLEEPSPQILDPPHGCKRHLFTIAGAGFTTQRWHCWQNQDGGHPQETVLLRPGFCYLWR